MTPLPPMRVASTMSDSFSGWIDTPPPGYSPVTRVVVRGWCFHRLGQPIVGIRVCGGGRRYYGRYGAARPDVEAAFPGETASHQSGYEVAVRLTTSTQPFHLEAQLPNGTWHLVQSLRLAGPGTLARVAEPWRWIRFGWKAAYGLPGAWSHLMNAERDYVVTRLRQHGWLNLQLSSHYAPQQLKPERFASRAGSRSNLPRVCIVTPSFEQGAYLEQTLESVLSQSGVEIEYIVQDGGSADGSAELLRRYASRLTRWESRPDGGQAAAIVRGFSHSAARGDDVMMYLNSDDLLMPGAVPFVAEYFSSHRDVDVVFGHRVLIDQRGLEIGRWFTPRSTLSDLSLHDFVPQETMFWRRRIWDRVGGIDPSLLFAMDWDLLLRFRAAGARFARLPWFLGAFRIHPLQKTATRLRTIGLSEIGAVRRRALGRDAKPEELQIAMRRGQVDSALVQAFHKLGWRL